MGRSCLGPLSKEQKPLNNSNFAARLAHWPGV
jgi:hypothetical protein